MPRRDLREWMGDIGREDVPDLWGAISGRTPRMEREPEPSRVHRLGVIAVCLVVVVVGVGLPLKALWPLRHREFGPASGPSAPLQTAQLMGASLSYPQDWALYESVGWGKDHDLWAAQLTNFDPGVQSTPLCPDGIRSTPDDGVGLIVTMQVKPGSSGTSQGWPTTLRQGTTDWTGPSCDPPGTVESASWRGSGDAQYSALAWFGPTASAEMRSTIEAAFTSLAFQPPVELTEISNDAVISARVLASRQWAGGHWSLLAFWSLNYEAADGAAVAFDRVTIPTGPVQNSVVDTPSLSGTDLGFNVEVHAGQSAPPAGAPPPAVVWGAASPEVTRIEVHSTNPSVNGPVEHRFEATILPFPDDISTEDNVFFVEIPGYALLGDLVALDADGKVIRTESLASHASPRPGAHLTTTYPPNPQPSPKPADDRQTQSNLTNALAVAKTYFTDSDTYSGFGPTPGVDIEPTLPWDTRSTASVGVISIRDVSSTTVLLVSASTSGKVFCVADNSETGTTWGATDAQTVAECIGPAWPGPPPMPQSSPPSGAVLDLVGHARYPSVSLTVGGKVVEGLRPSMILWGNSQGFVDYASPPPLPHVTLTAGTPLHIQGDAESWEVTLDPKGGGHADLITVTQGPTGTFDAPTGTYVMEVTGHWAEGTNTFTFEVELV